MLTVLYYMRALLKSSCAVVRDDRLCAQLCRDVEHEIRSLRLITYDVSRSKSLSDKIRIPIAEDSSNVYFSKRKSTRVCFDPFRKDKHASPISPIYYAYKCRFDFAGISSISYYFYSSTYIYMCVCV